jgi:hypothetical protein
MPFEPAASPPWPPPPAPPVIAPRVTVGSVISRSFSTWSKNVLLFAAFTVVVFLPVFLLFLVVGLSSLVSFTGQPPEGLMNMDHMLVPLLAIGLPVGLLAVLVHMCGLTYGAVQHLAGQPVRLGDMIVIAFRRFVPLILLGLLGILVVMGVSVVLGIVVGLSSIALGPMGGSVLMGILMIALMAFVGTAFIVTIPVLLSEGLGPIASLQRSWVLTRDRRLAIFFGALLVTLIGVGVSLGANVLATTGIVGAIVGVVVRILLMPLTTVIPGVVYSDLRIEKEGVSTADLAKVFE